MIIYQKIQFYYCFVQQQLKKYIKTQTENKKMYTNTILYNRVYICFGFALKSDFLEISHQHSQDKKELEKYCKKQCMFKTSDRNNIFFETVVF